MADTSAISYGRRLFPSYLDEIARINPGRVYAAVPKTTNVEDGFVDVTIADLARCVNFMAKWIEEKFGRSRNFETISYVGLSDLRGVALFLAAIKTGYKVLLASPRNPASSNLSLMEQTGSSKLLYSVEIAPLINPFRAIAPSSYHVEAIPSFLEMFESSPEHYPYEKGFDEARDDPILVLHSSGSTGPPKPIVYTHGGFAAHDMQHLLPTPDGRRRRDVSMFEFQDEARIYVIFPLFHLGGFVLYTFHTIFDTATIVIGPPHIPPNVGLLLSVAKQQKLRGAMIVPAMMEQLLHEPTGVELYKSLDFVIYGGAPLAPEVAHKLAPLLELVEFYGSSETLPLPELFKDPADYVYHEFNPNLKFEMQPYDPNEGTFELILLAKQEDRDTVALCHNVPGVERYQTKDLFTRHAMKENLWKYFGRKDDILVLANGEKVNPIPLELAVQGHPSLNGALLVGNGRNQTALLVEPKEALDTSAQKELLRILWPQIEKANNLISGQGRVAQDKIICISPDNPFFRTGKATIIRSLTERSYARELETLYSDLSPKNELAGLNLEATVKTSYEYTKIVNFLRQVFSVSYPAGANMGENEDFFSYGLDSVQTIEIARNLKRALGARSSKPIDWITPRIIFRNPTFAYLGNLLVEFLNEGIVPNTDEGSQAAVRREYESTVARHLDGLHMLKKASSKQAEVGGTSGVAILGSTGYLGRFLVAALLQDPNVSQIYCLNRSNDAAERQAPFLSAFVEDFASSKNKLIYLKIEIGKPLLGLSQSDYDLLGHEVDVVVYNAWKLDFGLSMRSFDPFLDATRQLVELAAVSKTNMHIIFVSSIAAVGQLALESVAPEASVEDPLAAIPIGYGLSKLAAEQVLLTANRQHGIPVSIARVGQVGGPSQAALTAVGQWADQPWISAMATTSKSLGALPRSVILLDWLPVDTVAAMLHAFVARPAQTDAQFYNVINYNSQSWDLLVEVLGEILGVSDTNDLAEWVERLQEIGDPSREDASRFPALKMLTVYETFGKARKPAGFATDNVRGVFQDEAPHLTKELLSSWFRDWKL